VKNLFLMSSLNFPWCSLIPFPHVLSLVTRERSAPPGSIAHLEEGVDCDEVTNQVTSDKLHKLQKSGELVP